MMERLWEDILCRFGQDVVLCEETERTAVRAMVQPLAGRGTEQEVAGVLGRERQESYRYLGPARHPLDVDTAVEWKGRCFRVRSAQLVGEGVCPYWQAVLCPREEEVL